MKDFWEFITYLIIALLGLSIYTVSTDEKRRGLATLVSIVCVCYLLAYYL